MANQKLMDVTEAFSDDITDVSSFVFYAMLDDNTSVGLPATELMKRQGTPKATSLRKITDQGFPTDGTETIVIMDSIYYDSGWWNADSSNILMVPDDEIELVHVFWGFQFNNASAGAHVKRSIRLGYTAVTSNDYGFGGPIISTSSVADKITTDYRTSVTGHWCPHNYWSPPIHIDSGDQFQLFAGTTGSASVDILEGFWGFVPFKWR